MTTENLFDVAAAREKIASLESRKMTLVETIKASSDMNAMMVASNQMVADANEIKRLQSAIDKVTGSKTTSKDKLDARDFAFSTLRNIVQTDAFVPVRDAVATIGKVKAIRIEFENGAVTGFSLVGGISTANPTTGEKRTVTRNAYTGGSLAKRVVSSWKLVELYGSKYNVSHDSGQKDKAAGIANIMSGEKITTTTSKAEKDERGPRNIRI